MRVIRGIALVGLLALSCTTTYGEIPVEITESDIEVSASDVDLGDAPCGRDTLLKSVAVVSRVDREIPWRVVVPEGSPFRVIGPTDGTIGTKGTVSVGFVVAPLEARAVEEEILVEAGGQLKRIVLRARGTGASLAFSPGIADFSEVRAQSGGKISLELRNDGNAPAAIPSFTVSSPDYAVTWSKQPAALEIIPGETVSIDVTLRPGALSAAPTTGTATPEVGNGHCGPAPTLALSGKRVNTDITVSTVDWSNVNCGTVAPTKTSTISNYGTTPISYTATVAAGGPFSIVSPTGTVPAATGTTAGVGTIALHATVGNVTGVQQQTLTVVATGGIGGPETKTAAVRMNVYGAVLRVTPLSLAFKSNNVRQYQGFTVTNTGNAPYRPGWGIIGGAGDFTLSAAPGTVPALGKVGGTVSFKSANPRNATLSATKSVTSTVPVCAVLPAVTLRAD